MLPGVVRFRGVLSVGLTRADVSGISTLAASLCFTPYYFCYSGYMGASLCMILSSWGSAWGTWRAGLGVCNMGIDHPAGIIKNIVPIVMAGVLGIYGLIVAVIITQSVIPPVNGGNQYSVYNGYTHVCFCTRRP